MKNTTKKTSHPPPGELKTRIEYPPGVAKEIAAWLKVPVRTFYDWIQGRPMSSMYRNNLPFKLPAGADVNMLRTAFYTAWWNAQQDSIRTSKSKAPAPAPAPAPTKDTNQADIEALL